MSIFQRFKDWINRTYKLSEHPTTCKQCQDNAHTPDNHKHIKDHHIPDPHQSKHMRNNHSKKRSRDTLYQISMNIKSDGEQTFDISFPKGVDDEQNAIIISEMMYRLTTALGQEFHNAISSGDKQSEVLAMALDMWEQLVNNRHHGGVVIPPTRVFSSSQ